MAVQTKFICSCCGKEQTEWPALAFDAPWHYKELTQQEKDTIAEIGSDFCIIKHPDQTDRFIRCTLTQKVDGHCAGLDYGIWVSLSEKSFEDYSSNFGNEHHFNEYFGWLCNVIPGYEFNESVPTKVVTRAGNQRPEVIPYEDFDHPFVKDYYSGITAAEAQRRIDVVLGNQPGTATIPEKKPWWKIW